MKQMAVHMFTCRFSWVRLIKWRMKFTKWLLLNSLIVCVQKHARISEIYALELLREMAKSWPILILNSIESYQDHLFKVETSEKHLVSYHWNQNISKRFHLLFYRTRSRLIFNFRRRWIRRWELQHEAYRTRTFRHVQKKWLCQYKWVSILRHPWRSTFIHG